MKLTFNQFKGMAPKIDPALAAPGIAREVINGRFSRGGFTPVAVDADAIAFSSLNSNVVGTLSRPNGGFYSSMAKAWFFFSQRVSSGVDSLIAPQDEYSQIFFANETGPRYMVSDQYEENAVNLNRSSYKLGVPFPESPPTVSLITDNGNEESLRQSIAYIFTLVDNFGHEGPPSTPSNTIKVPVEETFKTRVSMSVEGMDFGSRPFAASQARKRIYRTTQGTDSSGYQFVGEVSFGTSTFDDTTPYGEEGPLIQSGNWYSPPAEIKDIDAVASNFLAGFYNGNILAFSEVKLPHAWPLSTRYPLRSRIVKILSTDNGLFIGTEGKPYWAIGADPSAAIPVELPEDFPCVSADSVVDMGGGVIYATHDGLVALNSQGGQIITSDVFAREQWQDLVPAELKAWSYEGRYLFYSKSQKVLYSIIPGDSTSLTKMEMFHTVQDSLDSLSIVVRNPQNDTTVLGFSAQSAPAIAGMINDRPEFAKFVSGSQLTPDTTFVFARVLADNFPVTVVLNGVDDSGQITSVTLNVQNSKPFRIKRLPRRREWYVELSIAEYGTTLIRQVDVFQSIREIV